jgi:hypothetical protein
MKELVAEVIGDGNMFDKARQEKAIAGGAINTATNLSAKNAKCDDRPVPGV